MVGFTRGILTDASTIKEMVNHAASEPFNATVMAFCEDGTPKTATAIVIVLPEALVKEYREHDNPQFKLEIVDGNAGEREPSTDGGGGPGDQAEAKGELPQPSLGSLTGEHQISGPHKPPGSDSIRDE